MRVVVDGVETWVDVDHHLVDEVLVPALAALGAPDDGRARRFAFLVAPPGTGKSTLAAVVRNRARHAGLDLDTIGIDGFHRPQAYLETHRGADGEPLAAVKGAPETFDVALLEDFLTRSATRDLLWPVYDRTIHDVVPAARHIGAGLVLLEGNWLLLDEPGWRDLGAHSAFTVFVDADPALLRERLIRRKVRGGLDRASAERFHERSDGPNVLRVLRDSDLSPVDLLLHLNADGTIERKD